MTSIGGVSSLFNERLKMQCMPTFKVQMLELGYLLTRSRRLVDSTVFFCRLVCGM